MTENEAIEKLKNMRLFMQIEDKNNNCKFTEDDYKANEMAIQALEKQMPMKPVKGEPYYWIDSVKVQGRYRDVRKKAYQTTCPICSSTVLTSTNFCRGCGQKLDWSDND